MSESFIKTRIRREVVDSTSDLARQLVVEGTVACPLLVLARRQTRGRGRGDHSWWSDSGSLTFTVALDPAAHGLRAEQEPRLALASAVAVVDAIAPRLDPRRGRPGIRWPNDVEVADRKVAGILPERVETALGPRLLIGIGLNVATRLAEAPAEVRSMAASLADLASAEARPEETDALLEAILDRLASILPRLAADDPELASRWAGLDTLRDRPVRVDLGPRVVSGLGRGIDADGALLLEEGGRTLRLFGGRVLRGEGPPPG